MGVADKPWTGGNSLLYGGFVAVRACGSLMGEDMRRDKAVGTGNGVALAFGVGANDRDVVTGSVAVETLVAANGDVDGCAVRLAHSPPYPLCRKRECVLNDE